MLFLVQVYYTHPGFRTSIFGKNRAYCIRDFTVVFLVMCDRLRWLSVSFSAYKNIGISCDHILSYDDDDAAAVDDCDGVVKAEAERLRQQREMQHEEEFSQLKLAEEELIQVNSSPLLLTCQLLWIFSYMTTIQLACLVFSSND